MRKTRWVFLLALFPALLAAQNVDNTQYVREYLRAHPNWTIGQATSAAQAACYPDTSIPCVIVLDPSLVKYAPGAMPSPCTQCQWLDYRNGAPYVPTGGGSMSGVFQVKPINPAFGVPSSSIATGFYLNPVYQGLTASAFSNNLFFYPFYQNFTFQRPGYNRGAISVNSAGNPNWTVHQGLNINVNGYSQGLVNGTINEFHEGIGDTLPLYVYGQCNGDGLLPDDEGCRAISGTTAEGGNQGSQANYQGTVTTGGSGATQIKTTATISGGSAGDGMILLDLNPVLSTYLTARASAPSAETPAKWTIAGTVTASTAWGTLASNVLTPVGSPVGTGSTSETFNVNVASGTFVVGQLACMSGQMHDMGVVSAVGVPSGGVQSVTVPLRQPHESGSWIMQGGLCGTFGVASAQISDGHKYPVDILGATDAHTLVARPFVKGGQPGDTANDYWVTNLVLGTFAISSLSNSGTTVSLNFNPGLVGHLYFKNAPVVTISGASDSAFNGQCNNLAFSSNTAATCTISGISGVHTAASASMALGDTVAGNGDLTIYAGAEILDVQDAANSNAVDGAYTLEPNIGAWANGDTVEAEFSPAAIFAGENLNVIVHNQNPYSLFGLSVNMEGSGVSAGAYGNPSAVILANNSNSYTHYQYFGGLETPIDGVLLTGLFNHILSSAHAPGFGDTAIHVGAPFSGTGDALYYYGYFLADCAAGTDASGCGLNFAPSSNTFSDNNASDSWQLYNLQVFKAGVPRSVVTSDGAAHTSGHVATWDTNGNLADGGASLTPVYDTGGIQKASAHSVIGQCTMTAGTCTITLTSASVFTASTTYQCAPSDTTTAAAVKWSPISGTQFSLAGTATDVVSFICTGN